MAPEPFGLRGFLLDAPERGKLRARRDGGIVVKGGRIAAVGDFSDLQKAEPGLAWRHGGGAVIFPGLIDSHSHVPQYPAVARGQTELLPWLHRYIFPLEREFRGEKARAQSARFFAELARHGTTTAMLYTTIFEESCEAAFEAARVSGQRAIIGKVMMDVGSYGDLPTEKIAAVSLEESERLCQKWHGANDGLLDYAFSPRFAVSCSRGLMTDAAWLAKAHGCYIQTHLSENPGELERVKELHPWAEDYTDVYAKCGMLGGKTVLAHCVHLSEKERAVLAETNSVVAHCPSANLFLGSGIMPLGETLGAGIRVALGTDVAAGPELNLWQVMRTAIESQKARSFFQKNAVVPMPAEMLFLATQGAADALGKSAALGSLDVGKEADFTIIDSQALLPYSKNTDARDELDGEELLSLCVYRGGPRATAETLVRGRTVYRAGFLEIPFV